MKLLGLDFGTQRIGYAVSDTNTKIAFGRDVISNDHRVFDTIQSICKEEAVEQIILGFPRSSDAGDVVESAVRDFGSELSKKTGLTVVYQDERMTSRVSHDVLQEQNIKMKDRKGKVDVLAAQTILQQWMDTHAGDM